MRRRDFFGALSLLGRSPQPAMPVIGDLSGANLCARAELGRHHGPWGLAAEPWPRAI